MEVILGVPAPTHQYPTASHKVVAISEAIGTEYKQVAEAHFKLQWIWNVKHTIVLHLHTTCDQDHVATVDCFAI